MLLVASLVSVPAAAAPFVMDFIETDDFRLLYLDPFQTYLTPHVARTFENSLDFQRRIFDWVPYDKSTLLLIDLADYGNAGAGASPSNGLTIYIAPPSHTCDVMG